MTTTLLTLPVPAVRDDATRREFLAGLAAAGSLAACRGSGTGDEASNPSPAQRTIDHLGGTTEVPLSLWRVVTLSEAIDGHLTLTW